MHWRVQDVKQPSSQQHPEHCKLKFSHFICKCWSHVHISMLTCALESPGACRRPSVKQASSDSSAPFRRHSVSRLAPPSARLHGISPNSLESRMRAQTPLKANSHAEQGAAGKPARAAAATPTSLPSTTLDADQVLLNLESQPSPGGAVADRQPGTYPVHYVAAALAEGHSSGFAPTSPRPGSPRAGS